MKYSSLFFGLAGLAAGVLLAPKIGIWNKQLTRKAKQGQNMLSCGIKRTEAKVADVADAVIDTLEKGRKTILA